MMKYSLLVVFVINALLGCSSNYYVSNDGDDSNSGTSKKTPWKTIVKVNKHKFKAGDSIFFKGGDKFFGQLVPRSGGLNQHVTYTSYGKGGKPMLHHSKSLGKSNDWENIGDNLWKSSKNKTFDNDVGNMVFNNDKEFGRKVPRQEELIAQGDFYYEPQSGSVVLYSLKNPAKYYKNILCLYGKAVIWQNNRSNVTYDNLWLGYCGGFGIAGGNTSHIVVKNCDISYMGGRYLEGYKEGITRSGNGIEFWAAANNNLVEGCKIWEIYDAALTNQSADKGDQTNIIYRNNTIWNSEYSFEFFHWDKSSKVDNIQFINNTCFNAGYGWGNAQRPKKSGRHICFWELLDNSSNIVIKNNVMKNAKESLIYIPDADFGIEKQVSMDYNSLFQRNGKIAIIESNGEVYKFGPGEFEKYQKLTGFGKNSKYVDTELVEKY